MTYTILYSSRDTEGRLHSTDDEPSVITTTGRRYWHKHGKLHRADNKPAVVTPNTRKFYHDGELLRTEEQPSWVDPSLLVVYTEEKQEDKKENNNITCTSALQTLLICCLQSLPSSCRRDQKTM